MSEEEKKDKPDKDPINYLHRLADEIQESLYLKFMNAFRGSIPGGLAILEKVCKDAFNDNEQHVRYFAASCLVFAVSHFLHSGEDPDKLKFTVGGMIASFHKKIPEFDKHMEAVSRVEKAIESLKDKKANAPVKDSADLLSKIQSELSGLVAGFQEEKNGIRNK